MPYVFKMQSGVKEKIKIDPMVRLAYLHLLLREHQRWREEGLILCERIETHTLNYLTSQDVYCSWISENFNPDPNSYVERIVVEELFKIQKKSISAIFGNVRKDNFIKELQTTERLGPLTNEVWTGWTFSDPSTRRHILDILQRNNVTLPRPPTHLMSSPSNMIMSS